jgi:carotenoid cleavage dioxygenase-like enzyme
MHSFAVTERHIVLVEFPLVVAPWRLMLSGRPFIENYRWQPQQGSRFLVIDRDDGQVRATCHADAFFAFHHINAFERDGEIVLDVAAYPDAAIIQALYLDRLRNPQQPVPTAELRRYRVPLTDAAAEYDVVGDDVIELPRINYGRCNGRDYRFVHGIGRQKGTADFYNQLVCIDVATGSSKTWSDTDCYPGEPVFVAAPDAREENDGVILSVVLDARKRNSCLLILDAAAFQEIARAEVPQHVPFGFHGQFLSS